MEKKEILKKILQNDNRKKVAKALCKFYFKEKISNLQAELISKILFYRENGLKKISVCAMTRWGKSFCVSRAIALNFLTQSGIKAFFIGPQQDQARILRDYMAELILKCPELLQLAHLEVAGVEKIQKEASRTRMTFKNGCEYRVFSAEGDATRLMGHGLGSSGGILIKDEATKISSEANTKISRMKGDCPENVLEIELFNPWDRDNRAFEHYSSGDWDVFQVGWKEAEKDKRVTKLFIEEQRKELTPLEFTVLYESEFPEESEDSIFNLARIKEAEVRSPKYDEYLQAMELLKEPYKYRESEVKEAKDVLKDFRFVISCDVADKGLDESVILVGFKIGNYYEIFDFYSEPKTENIELSRRITKYVNKLTTYAQKIQVNIDTIGVGAGVVSYVKDWIKEKGLGDYVVVRACHFGNKAIKKERFSNMKAENYFRLRQFLIDGLIKIPQMQKFKSQAMAMKWDTTSSEKIKIIDPEEKSPDWCDSMVYFTWKDNSELIADFI